MQASFTQEGVKGLAREGWSKRRQAVEEFFGSAGGKLEVLYFAFGYTDVFAIADLPDNVSAAALSLAANAACEWPPAILESLAGLAERASGFGGSKRLSRGRTFGRALSADMDQCN